MLEKYQIKIRASVNGVERKPSKIAWIYGSDNCLSTPCYVENDYIVIELIPGCEGLACIEGYLYFDDKCENCEPVYFKRCFCSPDVKCPDCSQCINGVCVDICKDNEFCKDNTCLECDPEHPCPNNLICKDGKCVCPPGLIRVGDRCVECTDATILDKCHICKDGIITPICTGACDPLVGDCVDCLTAGDCSNRPDGKNCCDNKNCVCCPGFQWDNTLKKCIPIPCTDDSCPECQKCTKDGCVPIECPDGYKCWKGECVLWPCTSTSCSNGADCGEGCGCIELDGVKQCIPCHLLDCKTGVCKTALGCKCDPTDKCISANTCGDVYCDAENPCTKPGCTCYNNKCVDCSNFPCTTTDGGCASFNNCECQDGDCKGKDCKGDLKVEKLEDCGTEKGCKLKATLPKDSCKCDPIIFKTQNLAKCDTVAGPTFPDSGASKTLPSPLLLIRTALFKKINNVDKPYASYLTDSSFADDEKVTGNVKSIISYQYLKDGKLVNYAGTIQTSTSPQEAIVDNKVLDLSFNSDHIRKIITIGGVNYKTKIIIKVVVDSLKVTNANCINYENGVQIAEYILDYTTEAKETETCTRLSGIYKDFQVKSILDNISSKKPKFTWFRSSTSTFNKDSIAYVYDAKYDQFGWFRKVFGKLSGTDWTDEVNNPQLEIVDANGELLSNYNYQVSVDCGCGKRTDIVEKLNFCCPKDLTYKIDPCKNTVKIEPFTVCSVNGLLSDSANYKLPKESQVLYYLEVTLADGTIVKEKIEFTSSTKSNVFNKTFASTITLAKVYQTFSGGLLGEQELCIKTLDVPKIELPDPAVIPNCDDLNKIVYTLLQTTPKITTIQPIVDGSSLQAQIAGTNQTVISLDRYNSEGKPYTKYEALLTYSSGCVKKITLPLCPPDIIITPNPANAVSTKECSVPGPGVTLTTTVTGFDQTQIINYSLSNGEANTTGVFTNLGVGNYTVNAEQNGLVVTTTQQVTAAESIDAYLENSSICQGASTKLIITGPVGSELVINAPNTTGITAIIGVTKQYVLANQSTPGTYTVTLANNNKNTLCFPFTKTLTLSVGGQALIPLIDIQAGPYCVGQQIPFRITDNNVGATYELSSISGTVTSPLVATSSGYNGIFTPTSTQSTIQVTKAVGDCNTITPNSVTISASPLPTIQSATSLCNQDNSHKVTVITTASSVIIGGLTPIQTGNTWVLDNITGLSIVDVVATTGTCSITREVTLNNCECPLGTVGIIADNDGITCGQGTIAVKYNGSSLPVNNTWQYVFQIQNFGNWVDVDILQNFTLPVIPNYNVNTTIGQTDLYRIKIINTINNCEYYSDSYGITAQQAPNNVSITPSILGNITTNTPVTFSTQQGYLSYIWAGAVTGNTYQSNSVQFSTPGIKTVSVTVCNGLNCCVTETIEVIVVAQGCINPITYSRIPADPIPGCQKTVRYSILSGGTGTIYYSVSGGLTISETAITNGNFEIDTSNINYGATLSFTVTMYDRFGCETIDNISITRPTSINTNTISLDVSTIIPLTHKWAGVNLVRLVRCVNNNSNFGQQLTLLNQATPQYVVFTDGTCTSVPTATMDDLVIFINNYMITNNIDMTVGWVQATRQFTLTATDPNSTPLYERIILNIQGNDLASACTNITASTNVTINIDLPCNVCQ